MSMWISPKDRGPMNKASRHCIVKNPLKQGQWRYMPNGDISPRARGRGAGKLKRQGSTPFWVQQKLSPKNALSKTLHDTLKFQHTCSIRQLKRFRMMIFLAAQSFTIKFYLFFTAWFLVFALFPHLPYFMTIYSPKLFIVRHHFHSDTSVVHGHPGLPLMYAPGQRYPSLF